MKQINIKCKYGINAIKYMFAFFLPVGFFLSFLALSDIYPFGDISITRDDMFYQYIDFFAYLKNVLSGTIGYEQTFSQSLGTSPVALIGYYLFSPLNFLVVFFEKSQLELFIVLITAIKIGLCGSFFALFISNRFKLSFVQIQILALAYAFTQYMVGQMSNIMWLDGVYMLPLLLFAVFRFIKTGKKGMLLCTVTMTVIFNWYTGYMNCIFIVIYYIYEVVIGDKLKPDWTILKKEAFNAVSFVFTEGAGVLLSCAVFLPIVLGQAQGRTFDDNVLTFGTNGKFGDIFRGFLIGSEVPGWSITLYCSILVLLAFFAYWFCKSIDIKHKIASGVLVAFMVFSMFFKPLEAVWVGFKYEASYVYRFAYIAIFTVIFVAASMMAKMKETDRKERNRCVICSGIFFIIMLLMCDTLKEFDKKRLWLQIAIIIGYIVLYLLIDAVRNDDKLFTCNRIKKAISVVLSGFIVIVFAFEIVLNSRAVAGDDYKFSQSSYENYVVEQEQLVERISEYDTSFYRMEQTSNRNNSIVVSNESLVYGYRGIQTYTSSYDEDAALLLRDMGYHIRVYPSVYLDSVLPADSFLGIKYLMSPTACVGYEKTEIESGNNKSVYYNPFALPFMFRVSGFVEDSEMFENSFDYLNALYSAVLGRDVNVFEKAEVADTVYLEDGGIDYTFTEGIQNKLLYCSFANKTMKNSGIYLNGEKCIDYSNGAWGMWENIRFVSEIDSMENILTVKNVGTEQEKVCAFFYSFDIEKFAEITDEIKAAAAEMLVFEDGYVEAVYEAEADERILFTVPYDDSWTITVNGEKVNAEKWADSLLCIPVTRGENVISMTYSAAGKVPGMIISTVTFVGILTVYIFNKKKSKFTNKLLTKNISN